MLMKAYKKLFSKVCFLVCFIALNACVHSQNDITKNDITKNDIETKSIATAYDISAITHKPNRYQLLLASLLDDVDSAHFSYINQQGIEKFDKLKHFKALEQVYISSIENKPNHKSLTTDQLKILLFFSFYAEQKNSAAFLEYLAADLMPVYKTQTKEFLKLLNNYSFLVKPNCGRLNAYFGFEGKNRSEKTSFLSTNSDLILEYLSSENAKICLNELD